MDDYEKYRAVWELRVANKDHTDSEFASLLTQIGVKDSETLVREARKLAYSKMTRERVTAMTSRIDQLNENVQEAKTSRELWQITQSCSLRELRAICDLNGHDAEFMTQADCLAAIANDKGFDQPC